MIGRVNTGGGSALNFSLKAYSTEAALLADTPKENTVGIVTETAITDYAFAVENPFSSSSAQAGSVWIKTSSTSPAPFGALKKSTLMVYPIASYQYVGSSWVEKTMKVYKSGGWASLTTWLYNNGTTVVPWTSYLGDSRASRSVTLNTDSVDIFGFGSSQGSGSAAFETTSSCDLTSVDTIYFKCYTGGGGTKRLYVKSTKCTASGGVGANALVGGDVQVDVTNTVTQLISLDVSNLTGSFYIGACCQSPYTQPSHVHLYLLECYY